MYKPMDGYIYGQIYKSMDGFMKLWMVGLINLLSLLSCSGNACTTVLTFGNSIPRQIDRQIGRQIDRQTDRQTDRQIDREIDR